MLLDYIVQVKYSSTLWSIYMTHQNYQFAILWDHCAQLPTTKKMEFAIDTIDT
jgi:hypothetical protein